MSATPKRTRPINDTGIGFAGIDQERLRDLRVYVEHGSVLVWAEISHKPDHDTVEAFQYLTPIEAMAFAKAFERCAIEALKEAA